MYAKVRFLRDHEEMVVPLSFIQSFDLTKYKKHLSYWVFWSRGKAFSPSEMLNEVDEIPKYNDNMEPSVPIDESFNGAGFHRALVLAIGDSEETLLKSNKRAPAGAQKLIVQRSFDEQHSVKAKPAGDGQKRKGKGLNLKQIRKRASLQSMNSLRKKINSSAQSSAKEDKSNTVSAPSDMFMPVEVILTEEEERPEPAADTKKSGVQTKNPGSLDDQATLKEHSETEVPTKVINQVKSDQSDEHSTKKHNLETGSNQGDDHSTIWQI